MDIAIVGRPNVGKSTIFNRLAGKDLALIEDTPGVTRDRRTARGYIADLEFNIIDTAGLEQVESKNKLEARMMAQTEIAILDCDLVLLVIDGIVGVTSDDLHFAKWVRKKGKDVILLVNKCEGKKSDLAVSDSHKLGFPNIVFLSAAHNLGFNDLYDELIKFKDNFKEKEEKAEVTIAIIGRPNAGKSTLVNYILQEERMITGPEAGITRDSISINVNYKGKLIKLVDTAGLRKRGKVNDKLEKMSVNDTMRAIFYAQVVVLLIDATSPLDKQDLSIAELAIKEGRAIVIAINKWDIVKDKNEIYQEIKYKVEKLLPSIKGVPLIFISALMGEKVDLLFDAIYQNFELWNLRISTNKLNDWIIYATNKHQIPLNNHGKRPKIKFITQHKTRPPTFFLSTNFPEAIDESYIRYLTNQMREDFGFLGVPIRFILRKKHNPYNTTKT